MSLILLPQRFLAQPQYSAPIHPAWLSRGLVIACNPAIGAYNQVTRRFITNSGGMETTPTSRGKSWQGAASKYIDFGANYAPGGGGATAIQVINPGSAVNVFSVSSRVSSGSPGVEILIGNGGVAGAARARLDTVAVTSDVTGLNDGRDHVLAVRYTPSQELKIWADTIGKSSAVTSSIPASITPDQNLRLHSRGATYYTGKSGLFLYFDTALPDSLIAQLLENPSVVYQAPSRRLWAVSSETTNYTLTADPFTLDFVGSAADLEYSRVLAADSVSLSLDVADATLKRGHTLTADPVSLDFSGADAVLRHDRVLQADSASIQITGADASLEYNRVLQAGSATIQFSVADAALTYSQPGNYVLTAESAALGFGVADASLRYDRKFTAEPAEMAFNGADASLRYARAVIAEAVQIAFNVADATLTRTGGPEPITSIVERTATFQRSKSVTVRFN